MKRRTFLATLPATFAVNGLAAIGSHRRSWDEITVPELQAAFAKGKLSSAGLVRHYLERIEKIDRSGPRVNSVIEINPEAQSIARALDKERKAGAVRSPLHGIPVLIKDNIATTDRMETTAGSLALLGARTQREAFLVKRLREAGAVILGKTNLSEWANFRSSRSTSGWSGRGGLTRNPYALDRNTSGSSSGSGAAVAANLCAVAIGTETDGSIVSPSTVCGIVGLKPTVGLLSRTGIIPISSTQDTAGPMTRTVTDAAILLTVLTGSDSEDEATAASSVKAAKDYSVFLQKDGLRGARIGVARQLFRVRNERVTPLIEKALNTLRDAGAELVDPVEIPSFRKMGDAEFQLMLYEFKAGLNQYLTDLADTPIKSLTDLIAFNEAHAETELRYFGQETLIAAEKKGPLTEQAYLDAREHSRRVSRDEGIDAVMDQHRLDALVAPTGGPAHRTDLLLGDRDFGGSSSYAAAAGYPNITVPAGTIAGMPFGISLFGRAWSEPTLIKLAYSFEQATLARRAPSFPYSVAEL